MKIVIALMLACCVAVMTDACPMLCGMDYSPVCGSDAQTYSNRCQMEVVACSTKKEITVAHEGACVEEPVVAVDPAACMKVCNRRYAPVCGTDGVTYSSQCQMEVDVCQRGAAVEVAYDGEC